MRKIIAKRLLESTLTLRHSYVTIEIEMDKLMAMRANFNKQNNTPRTGPASSAGLQSFSRNMYFALQIVSSLLPLPAFPACASAPSGGTSEVYQGCKGYEAASNERRASRSFGRLSLTPCLLSADCVMAITQSRQQGITCRFWSRRRPSCPSCRRAARTGCKHTQSVSTCHGTWEMSSS